MMAGKIPSCPNNLARFGIQTSCSRTAKVDKTQSLTRRWGRRRIAVISDIELRPGNFEQDLVDNFFPRGQFHGNHGELLAIFGGIGTPDTPRLNHRAGP